LLALGPLPAGKTCLRQRSSSSSPR
jgi:hypothetical protein